MAFPTPFYPGEVTLLSADASASTNGEALFVQDFSFVGVQLTAASSWDGTVTFEASADGTAFGAVQGENISDGTLVTTATGTTLDARFRFDLAGFKLFRTRVSGRTTGTITADVRRERQ